jgi:hypothetical protein
MVVKPRGELTVTLKLAFEPVVQGLGSVLETLNVW